MHFTPLHVAAGNGHAAVAQLLVQAAPDAAMVSDSEGITPLCQAVQYNDAAVTRVLLRVAPQAALVPFREWLPLHTAAIRGKDALVELLLEAAPSAALVPSSADGRLPLHLAAAGGHRRSVELLLATVPAAAAVREEYGHTPLQLALLIAEPRPACAAAARCLAAAGPAEEALECLLDSEAPDDVVMPLFADCMLAHLPLTAQAWGLVPQGCPGLGRALPAALELSTAQAEQVVRRMLPGDALRLRTFALCLARLQRRARLWLPPPLTGRILSLFDS